MMHPRELLEEYLRHMREIHATGAGVREESLYGPLERLLDAVYRRVQADARPL